MTTRFICLAFVALLVLSGCMSGGSSHTHPDDHVVTNGDTPTVPYAVEVFDHFEWNQHTIEFGGLKGIDDSLSAWVSSTLPPSRYPFGYATCAAIGCTFPEPVVWRGRLAGVTADTHEEVRGDVELRVELEHLTGDLTFDRLSWERAPLRYDVQVRDTGFESANGEAEGEFYGSGHEVIAGTVYRSDLVGAFGGMRR